MSRHFRCKLLLLSTLLLTGCTTPLAESSLHKNASAKASGVHVQQTNTFTPAQTQSRLSVIESLIMAGDSDNAKNQADLIDPANLSPHQRNLLHLYYAQIDLSIGEAEQALSRLNLIQPHQLNRPNIIKYYQARAFGYSLIGNLLASAASRIELSALLDAEQQQENNAAIFEALNLMPLAELEHNLPQTSAILSGWIALAHALKRQEQSPDLGQSPLQNWRLAYPQHPANVGFLDRYLAQIHSVFKQPKAIAVFLPESGSFALAGKAIREGIMAAYYQDTDSVKPSLRFYDSEAAVLPALYHQALNEGAELIIGPLSKPDIQSLADSVNFTIPVLALNHIPEITHPHLYQFGLSPIDDAGQITRKALIDGHKKALILIPNSEQGTRIGEYLKEYWEHSGGMLLETQVYDQKQTDFADTLKKLLNLDESEQRYQHIRRFIPALQYSPRRRQDADVIFLNAYETAARSINPQLKFYHANHLPVYATPQIYSGLPNPSLDFDLNGIIFCDTPWLFDRVYQGDLSLNALRSVWQQFPAIYLRLLAMGIDAYKLIPYLGNLNNAQYRGATGNLTLTDGNRIQRSLVCAAFDQGLPNVSGFIESHAPSYDHNTNAVESIQEISVAE